MAIKPLLRIVTVYLLPNALLHAQGWGKMQVNIKKGQRGSEIHAYLGPKCQFYMVISDTA